MDPLVLLLLVIIVLAGGFIGVLADHLGRRIGKKKLSFRSMRPKHVARLGTFIAGAMVSLFTILLVYSTSSGIRDWIREGRSAIAKSRLLTSQNADLESQIAAKTRHIDDLDREAKVARKNLNVATVKLETIESKLAIANSQLAASKALVTKGRIALARNQALLRDNQAILKARQAQLARVAANLRVARERYAALQRSYQAVDKERLEANEEVVRIRKEANDLSGEVASLRKESDTLTKEAEAAKDDLRTARASLQESQDQLVTVKNDLEGARVELRKVETEAIGFLTLTKQTRTEPLVYAKGQEVTRKRVGPHLSERQSHDAITGLIREASQAAQARGSGGRNEGDLLAYVPAQQPDGGGDTVEPQQMEDAITAELMRSDRDVVLIATAGVNSFKGEPVPLRIEGYPNPVVYHKGDVLAALSIPRRSPARTVIALIIDFMNQQVRDRAIKDGMIPAAGQEDSLFDLEPAKFYDLVGRLTNSERAQQLQIVSRAETRAADTLQLDFIIK